MSDEQYAHLEITGTLYRDAQVRTSQSGQDYLSAIVDVAKETKKMGTMHQKYRLLVFDFDILDKMPAMGRGTLLRVFGDHRPEKPSPCGKYSNACIVATKLDIVRLMPPEQDAQPSNNAGAIDDEIPF